MTWAGPRNDVLTLLTESPTGDYLAAPADDPDLIIYRVVNESGEPEGSVVGIEIVDFLNFDRWDALPDLDVLWQLPGQEPLPLEALLKREQARLRRHAATQARKASAA